MKVVTQCACGNIRCREFQVAPMLRPPGCRGDATHVLVIDGSETQDMIKRAQIELVLKQLDGSVTHTARRVGISTRTIQRNQKRWLLENSHILNFPGDYRNASQS